MVISSTAIAVSRRAGMLSGLGVAASTLTWATAVMLGLGLLLAQAVWLFEAIKLAGAAYLIWLGVRMIFTTHKRQISSDMKPVHPMTAMRYISKGYLLSVSNPTAAIFFGSVFSAMLPSSAPIWVYSVAVLLVTFLSVTWHCGIAVVFGVRPVQVIYRRMKRSIDTVAGTFLVLLGLRLATSR